MNPTDSEPRNHGPKDPEQMWRDAFPDPPPATNCHRRVILGSEIGALIGALATGVWFIRFLESEYATTIFELMNHESGLLFFVVGCLPGLLLGGLIGAFIGSRIPPR